MQRRSETPDQTCRVADAVSELPLGVTFSGASTPHSGILGGIADPRSGAAFLETAARGDGQDAAALPEVVYTPDSGLSHPLTMLRGLISDIYAGRELAWRLFVRNIRAQYRQTLLGFFWVLIPPVATTLLWVVLQANRVVNFQSPAAVPYILYVLTGTVLWGIFMTAVTGPMAAINTGKEMLSKLRFPREALLMTNIGHTVFNFVLQLILLIPVFIFFRTSFSATTFLFPIGVVVLLLLGLSVGLLLAPIGLLYKDVGSAIGVLGRFGMYLTPVIYQPLSGRMGEIINWVNPVAPVLTATRDWLLVGQTDCLAGFLVYGMAAILFSIVGLIILRLSMPIIIERT